MPTDLPPGEPDDTQEDDGYGPPAALDEGRVARRRSGGTAAVRPDEGPGDPGQDPAAGPPGRQRALKVGLGLAALALAVAALLGYRSLQRGRALAEGLPKAEALLRLDTAAGFRGAADLLQPLAKLDPLQAGSMRAFALAMLAADYRDPEAADRAEALLVEPSRAAEVPDYANLATAANFLGRRMVADAATYAGRAGRHPWNGALQGRIAFLAGNLAAAVEPLDAATTTDPGLAAALALQGDLARRLHRDPVAARTAYLAALAASPQNPRSAYGLSKLALASQVPLAEALAPLRRLVADAQTPVNERARAALHLAALELRSGDRAAATAALGTVADLDPRASTWAEQAAVAMAGDRAGYRAILDAPAPFQSASDDDPPALSAVPPPPPPAPSPAARPARVATSKAAKPSRTVKSGKVARPSTAKAAAFGKVTKPAKAPVRKAAAPKAGSAAAKKAAASRKAATATPKKPAPAKKPVR